MALSLLSFVMTKFNVQIDDCIWFLEIWRDDQTTKLDDDVEEEYSIKRRFIPQHRQKNNG